MTTTSLALHDLVSVRERGSTVVRERTGARMDEGLFWAVWMFAACLLLMVVMWVWVLMESRASSADSVTPDADIRRVVLIESPSTG